MKLFPHVHRQSGIPLLVLSIVLSGCAVGPDYHPPAAPHGGSYLPGPAFTTTQAATVENGAAQTLAQDRDIPAEWWRLFQSPQLDALIRQAIKNSPTLEAAQAALNQAQEAVYAQKGFNFPTLQAGYSPSRIKLSGNTGGNSPGTQGNGSVIQTGANTPADQGGSSPFNAPVTYNWHSAQLTVGYVPDVFGANRRQVESLQAQADQLRFQREAAYLTLASNVVTAAIQDASLRAQIEAQEAIIADLTRSLALVQKQHDLGYASGADVAAQTAALAQARQSLPPLRKQQEQTRDLMHMLVGVLPDEHLGEDFTLASLHVPETLPVSLPSRLVEQRPDIRAAAEQVHAASAMVGVAKAARLPQFSIDANAGGNASVFKEMFWPSAQFFTLSGTVTQSVFDAGTLRHKQRAAEENLKQTEALYRSTVLTAFQNVADSLYALKDDAEALQAAADAENAARKSLDLVTRQHDLGYVNGLVLLNAEQAYRQAVIARVQAEATRLGDTAALFQALGGGWWNRKDPA